MRIGHIARERVGLLAHPVSPLAFAASVKCPFVVRSQSILCLTMCSSVSARASSAMPNKVLALTAPKLRPGRARPCASPGALPAIAARGAEPMASASKKHNR